MIPSKQSERTIQSTITGEEIAMSIDVAAMGHIMDVLSNLYSNRILAVVREYATNARDAMVESGRGDQAIEVTLPSTLAPFLRIKDFGVGLNAEDIRNMFSKYGASSKRDTNEQNGMLGLGSKSALTYTDQFTMVSNKDGVRTEVSITRSESGGGAMTVVDERETQKPNGTEIVVPVSRADIQRFEDEAAAFFSHWPAAEVRINGQPPKPLDGLRINDEFTVIEGRQSYVVMAGVAYPAQINHGMGWGHAVVARVATGAVEFVPSREALKDTPLTQATLDGCAAAFQAAKTGAIQRIVNEAKTPMQALQVAIKWGRTLGASLDSLTYRGLALPTRIEVPMSEPERHFVVSSRHQRVLGRHDRTSYIDASAVANAIYFHGYKAKGYSAQTRRKIDAFLGERHDKIVGFTDAPFIVLVPEVRDVPRQWVDPSRIFDWKDAHVMKVQGYVRGGSGRIPGSFDCYVNGMLIQGHPADELTEPMDEGNLYFYRGNRYESAAWASVLAGVNDEAVVACVPSNRIAKFQRDFPKAKGVISAVKDAFAAFEASVTATDKEALAVRGDYNLSVIQTILAHAKRMGVKIQDPALRRYEELLAHDLTAIERGRKLYGKVNLAISFPSSRNSPIHKYPLVDRYGLSGTKAEHAVHYVNMVYAMESSPRADIIA